MDEFGLPHPAAPPRPTTEIGPERAKTTLVRHALAPFLPYLLWAGAAGLLRIFTLSNRILSVDEPSYFAQAARLTSPEAFIYAFYYRVEVKTQIGLIPYLLAAALSPANATFLVHLFGLGAILISGAIMIAFTRRFLGSVWPGLTAALIWLLFLEIGPGYYPGGLDTTSYFPAPKLEYFQTPLILASLYLLAWGSGLAEPRPRQGGWHLLGAGLAWAGSILVKSSTLLLAPLYLVTPFLFRPRTAHGWRSSLAPVGALAVGTAVPLVAVFAPYLFNAPALSELRFNLVDLTQVYVTTNPLTVRILALLLTIPPLLLGGFFLLPLLMRWRLGARLPQPAGRALGLTLIAAFCVFVGYLPGRSYPYYLVPVIPLLALVVAGYLSLGLDALRAAGRGRAALLLGLILAVAYVGPQAPVLANYAAEAGQDTYLDDDRRRFDLDGLLAVIARESRANEAIWVYYNTPEIYGLSGRPPATRDPVGIWLATFWTPVWSERTQAELAQESPRLIVGINTPRFQQVSAQPLLDMPLVGPWIRSHYSCNPDQVRGVVICTRPAPPP